MSCPCPDLLQGVSLQTQPAKELTSLCLTLSDLCHQYLGEVA